MENNYIKLEPIKDKMELNDLIQKIDKIKIYEIHDDNIILSNLSNNSSMLMKLFNDCGQLQKGTQLFKCNVSLDKLMKYKDGTFGGAIMGKNGIEGQAHFSSVNDITKDVFSLMALKIPSIIVGEYFKFQINNKLTNIEEYLDKIYFNFKSEKLAKIKTIICELKDIEQNITSYSEDYIRNIKKDIREIYFYFKANINKENTITKDDNNINMFNRLKKNIEDFNFNSNMYKISSELLIHINILLYRFYIEKSDLKKANNIIINMIKDDIISQLKERNEKIIEMSDIFIQKIDIINSNKDTFFTKIPYWASITSAVFSSFISLFKFNKDSPITYIFPSISAVSIAAASKKAYDDKQNKNLEEDLKNFKYILNNIKNNFINDNNIKSLESFIYIMNNEIPILLYK